MGRKQTKLVKSQPLLVERHHKLWIPRAASGLSLLGLSPWTCRARATLLSWSLRCPPPSGLSLAPRGAARPGAAGDSAALSPEGRTSCRDDAPQPAEHRLAFVPRDSRGDTRSWPGRSGPSGARPSGGREGAQGGRAGREKAAFCHGGLPGRCGGDPGGSLRHLCKRSRERARGVGGWGGVTLRTPIWPGFAPVPEAKRQKSRLNAAAGLRPPLPSPTPCRSPAPAPAAPPCPLSLLAQMCADPC